MRDRHIPLFALLPILIAGASAYAAAVSVDVPDRYSSAGLDGPVAMVENPIDGTTWAAWAYRSRSEYDIAISARRASGSWSEPTFVGRDDDIDEVAPALAVDATGNLYLAFATRETGRIDLAILPFGSEAWCAPVPVTGAGERGLSPALAPVADRIVIAFRSPRGGLVIRSVPVYQSEARPNGIQDGPSGIDPLGDSDGGGGKPVIPGSGRKGA